MTLLPHEILELSQEATKAEIKSAYRKLSLQNHPDKNNRSAESTKKFIEIRAAYESMMEKFNNPSETENSKSQNDTENETPYWETYFSSNEFKKFKSEFFGFKLEVYELLKDGEFFTSKARIDYVAVRDCKSLDEIGIKDPKKIQQSLREKISDLFIKLEQSFRSMEQEVDQVLKYSGTSLYKISDETKIDTSTNIQNAIDIFGLSYNTSCNEIGAIITFTKTIFTLTSRAPEEDKETLEKKFNEVVKQIGIDGLELEVRELANQLNQIMIDNRNELAGESLIAALRGAVASQDLDKFFIISKLIGSDSLHINVGRTVQFNIVGEVISEAARSKVEEEKLLAMVQNLLEQRKFSPDEYSVKTSAEGGFYKVAQYLIDHNSPIRDLTAWDLFNYEGTENKFESFKWLKDHGIIVKPTMLRETICNDNLLFKINALKNPDNIKLAKDFFIRENMANSEQVEAIEQDCNNFISFTNSWDKDKILIHAISSGKIENVERLLDYGAKPEYQVLTSLHKASPEILALMLSKFESVKMHYSSDSTLLLARTISSKSVDNIKTLFAKGMEVYSNTHLILQDTIPEIAKIVLDQMRSQNPKEGTSSINSCTYHIYDDHNSYDHYKERWYNLYCKKYAYNLDTPQNCEVSKLVAEYLGETDKIDWSACE